MKILITGGCGLVGTNLAKFYSNQDLVVVDNFERSSLLGHKSDYSKIYYNRYCLEKLDIPIEELDISSPETWKIIDYKYGRFDVIFHMGAFVGVGASYKTPTRAIEINVDGTALMLESARKWKSKVIYPSTFKVYGITGDWQLERKNERARWTWKDAKWQEMGYPVDRFQNGPRSPYGAAKYAGELLCQEYAKSYGVPIGIFRMSNIYGEHQISFEEQGWLTWFIVSNQMGYPINIFGDGCQVRDLLYVSDLVQAFDSFIHSNIDLGIWNIGGGPENTLSLIEGVEEIEEQSEKLFSYLNFGEWRKSDLRIYVSDISKVKEDLKWTPTINPKQGITKILNWVRTSQILW